MIYVKEQVQLMYLKLTQNIDDHGLILYSIFSAGVDVFCWTHVDARTVPLYVE